MVDISEKIKPLCNFFPDSNLANEYHPHPVTVGLFLLFPILTVWHFFVLNSISHCLLHSCISFKSFCSLSQSSFSFILLRSLASPGNILIWLDTFSCISLMHIKNIIGVNTEPCSTPLVAVLYSDFSSLTISIHSNWNPHSEPPPPWATPLIFINMDIKSVNVKV